MFVVTYLEDGKRFYSNRPCHEYDALLLADVLRGQGKKNVEVRPEGEHHKEATEGTRES